MGRGRPKGSRDKEKRSTAARKQAEAALSQGLSPLQVMQAAMQKAWDIANRLEASGAADPEVLAMMRVASEEAAKAAPYIHARLANTTIDATLRRSAVEFTDAELAALAGEPGGEEGDCAAK